MTTSSPDERPLLICFDGSDDAREAIAEAAALLSARRALVLAVWQGASAMPAFGWVGAAGVDFDQIFAAAREGALRTAGEGAKLASDAGLAAEPVVIEALGPIWEAVVRAADDRDAAAIVMGSRGLSGVRSMLMGSVSTGVVHNAGRPVLVVRRSEA